MFVKIQINGGNWQDLKDYKQTKMKKERGERGQNSKNYKYILQTWNKNGKCNGWNDFLQAAKESKTENWF